MLRCVKNVYFSKIFSDDKIKQLMAKTAIPDIICKNEFVAVKIHFGEKGNKGYIQPKFVKPVVAEIKSIGAKPFLTDANTIYKGTRTDAVEHLNTAYEHGFDRCECPVIIADGLRGNSYVAVDVNLKHFKNVKIARDIHYADKIIFLTHFKGHEISGFGGALKNIGMGCASRQGKYELHNAVKPDIQTENCTGCGVCIKWCPAGALRLSGTRQSTSPLVLSEDKTDRGDKITINRDICIGCGECILSCEQNVIKIPWNESTKNVQEKIVEYAAGVLKNKKTVYLNFLNYITKFCDCYGTKEGPLVDDIGILASDDPIAIDQASVDLINKKTNCDFFKKIYPEIDWTVQLEYAEKLGIGCRKYNLIEI